MNHRILIDNNSKALDLARKAYYGGRTEAFYIGELDGDFYLLDVNSMYPFVMAAYSYPTVLLGMLNRVSVKELAEKIKWDLCIADVSVNTPEPCFPLRSKQGLLFPTGSFRTVLATSELAYGLDNGYINKVHCLAVYRAEQLFEDYVKYFFKLRQQYQADDNQAFTYLCKLMLNSLYGKFGQCGRVYEDVSNTDSLEIKTWTEYDADTREVVKYRQFGGLIQAYRTEGESFNSHPAIAAHVTSYARIWLWKLIRDAGKENVYYVDTDSLVVNRTGYDILSKLYLGDSLGELKLEKQFTHLAIHGPKDYAFGDKVKVKGVSTKATQITENAFTQEHFSKFKGMIEARDLNTMTVTKGTKILKRQYKKGLCEPGGQVIPFELKGNDFDAENLIYRHKARAELNSSMIGGIPEMTFATWLLSEIEAMAKDLGSRSIPYGGGFYDGQQTTAMYFQGMTTKELDARYQVFSEFAKTHPLDDQSPL